MSLLLVQDCYWGVMSSVTIEYTGVLLGVSRQVSLLYMQEVPWCVILTVTIACAGMLLGVSY